MAAVENVSDTAFWVAHYRARESARPDALFHDPLAERLSGTHGDAIARAIPGGVMTGWIVSLRTIIIDDFLRYAIGQGVDLILNLGAGLDTRPYRLDALDQKVTWVEVDYPAMIAYKEKQLASETPRCRLERVKLDLADPVARRSFLAGMNARSKNILVLTEGVLPYLSNEAVGALADDLHRQSNVRFWIADYMSSQALRFRRRFSRRHLRNAAFKFAPDDWFAFFDSRGWQCSDMHYYLEEATKVHRPLHLPLPFRIMMFLRWLASTPAQRKQAGKFAGFALLVPKVA
ncbi:SAM-dependent methyltransferase [Methylovirgula ligni]|uniref:S-adenosyl-L-methionine-dependent methyltransferase n=1 Tax=Methylovirgula ligni TaxID=569860 RepID=A0A3D9YTZ8_9HYPH|nr:SAM-dependent methyltransferase [Methylovirgula ligni]QAY96227.1 SAM-dependent methyltransferase [Methylovirgula ligni]REF86070.1 methyltransferase (TIGR00027 family) [Methylovirgula ligni]